MQIRLIFPCDFERNLNSAIQFRPAGRDRSFAHRANLQQFLRHQQGLSGVPVRRRQTANSGCDHRTRGNSNRVDCLRVSHRRLLQESATGCRISATSGSGGKAKDPALPAKRRFPPGRSPCTSVPGRRTDRSPALQLTLRAPLRNLGEARRSMNGIDGLFVVLPVFWRSRFS